MFETLTMAPPDPILGLTDAFRKDPNPDKINLGVGVYLDENGRVPVLATVREAARRLAETGTSASYLPIDGLPEYNAAVQQLLLGAGHPAIAEGRAATVQTPGGTGALRVAADFLRAVTGEAPTVWISDETWVNHQGIMEAAGLKVQVYPYYDGKSHSLRFEEMIEAIGRMSRGDVILLHGACHNPTGVDPTAEQWERIAEAVERQGLLPLIDFAYQGLAHGLDEDAAGVRLFARSGREALIASSFSKNFSLYNERVGALTLIAATADDAQRGLSHVKRAVRTNYSNPPHHGAALVATVLGDAQLRTQWAQEVAGIRGRISQMRELFVSQLAAKGVDRDFSFIVRQNGMFSYSGLTSEQVARLKDEYAIYIVRSGRINVAGITLQNIDRLTTAVAAVLKG